MVCDFKIGKPETSKTRLTASFLLEDSMEKVPTIAEINATPGWRERLRRQWDDALGIMPHKSQESGNSGNNKSQLSIHPPVKSQA